MLQQFTSTITRNTKTRVCLLTCRLTVCLPNADLVAELFPSKSGSSVSLEDQEGEPWMRMGKSGTHVADSAILVSSRFYRCKCKSFVLFIWFWSKKCHFMVFLMPWLIRKYSIPVYSRMGLHASYTPILVTLTTWHNPLRSSIIMAVPGKVRKPLRDLGLSKLSSDLGW